VGRCTWSVGSQACRQSSAALHVGSVTHARICGPHLLTMFTNTPRSCTHTNASESRAPAHYSTLYGCHTRPTRPHLGTQVLQQRHLRQVCVDQRQQQQLNVVRVTAPPEIAHISQELPAAHATEYIIGVSTCQVGKSCIFRLCQYLSATNKPTAAPVLRRLRPRRSLRKPLQQAPVLCSEVLQAMKVPALSI
jgi:hypothetical protein